jgi:glyoxylase-like metal-dependent hydrolase (beta-lactamase superfamily II)
MVNVYLLKGEKSVLIDAGVPGRKKSFLRGLEKAGVKPGEIELVIITHGHMDHIGIAKVIVEITGAKIAIHQREREWLETGRSPIPPGTTVLGKVLSALGRRIHEISVEPVVADIVLGDDGFSLDEYGIPGKVVYTPGHTLGSVSVLLESGEAFVGDLAMSARFMRLKPGPPIFAEDLDMVMQSWRVLLESGARTIYPAHGKPFSANVFRDLVS